MPLAIEPDRQPGDEHAGHRLCPTSSAKATSAISSVPRIAPTAAPTTNSTRSPGVRIADGPLRLSCAAGRRLGAALGGEQQAADGGQGEGGDHAGGRVAGRGQEGHQHRPDDEDELVDDRLHRQRRRQPVAAAQQVGPAHPDHRGDRRDARAGQPGREEHRPQRPVVADREQERDARRRRRSHDRQQHPPLPDGCRPAARSPGRPAPWSPRRRPRPPRPGRRSRSPTRPAAPQPRPTIDSGSRPMKAASTIGRACGRAQHLQVRIRHERSCPGSAEGGLTAR